MNDFQNIASYANSYEFAHRLLLIFNNNFKPSVSFNCVNLIHDNTWQIIELQNDQVKNTIDSIIMNNYK